MTDETYPCTNSIIYNNYRIIEKYIKKRREQLINQLINAGIAPEHIQDKSFTHLINQVGNIQTVEVYYEDNIKPLDDPNFINFNLETHTYSEYNIELAKQISYYMRLLAYYLILKGVDIETVSEADDLESRISLIQFVKKYQASQLKIIPDKTYRVLEEETIPYMLLDFNNNEITAGTLTLKQGNKIIARIEAGEELVITPKEIGAISYTLIYEGYAQYEYVEVPFIINVLKALPDINVNSFSSYDDTETYTITLEQGPEPPQKGATISFTASARDTDGYYLNDLPITFSINGEVQNTVTTSNGSATITYTIQTEEDLIVRAYTSKQVSNYIRIELISYFSKIKEMLQHIRYIFTDIKEEEGVLKSTHKYVTEINTVSDLDGIIYDIYAEDEEWGYFIFHPSKADYITEEEFNCLKRTLVDYHDDDEKLTTRTLEDVEKEFHSLTTEYFEIIKEKLQNVNHVYTRIEEDTNGTLIGIQKNASDIQNIIDLEGVIYNMYADEVKWGYSVFNTNRTYINSNDFDDLMNILVDYQDNGEEIIITTLGDINE